MVEAGVFFGCSRKVVRVRKEAAANILFGVNCYLVSWCTSESFIQILDLEWMSAILGIVI